MLFTDIEGSTTLLQRHGDVFAEALLQHHAILVGAVRSHGGTVHRSEGDSFFASFGATADAIAAAVAAQRQLADATWPMADPLAVRMGIHTGDALVIENEVIGLDVHRAARIMSVGWGGQILVSDAAAELVRGRDGDYTLEDLGDHRLKDLAAPERIHQVSIPGLRNAFPAIRSLDAVRNNLPVQLTGFVGRVREIDAVAALLATARAVTLTGPGGTGKTRLSLQVAAAVAERFPDGVFFVALAPVVDPARVMSEIGATLGLADAGSATPLERVIEFIEARELLLVLDNFEQILAAGPDIAKLLASAPRVRVLTSSRAPLRISGEHEFPVPPLGLPSGATASTESILASDAVLLFVARATAIRPDFVLDERTGPLVVEIAKRLDGLPLAIELAAARVRLLPLEAISSRLCHALDLLSSGAADVTDRQRTLRGAIDWSYDLLEAPAQRLFTRFSVFRGGADLEHLEEVCAPELGGDVFELVSVLVDHSLLRREEGTDDGRVRFVMLETIAEYAREAAANFPDAATVTERHTTFFLALAESAAPHLVGPERRDWLDLLEREHDNLRVVLARALDGGETRLGLCLFAALWRMWQARGHLAEAARLSPRILALPGAAEHPIELARAEEAAGGILYWQSDLRGAGVHYERVLDLARERGDQVAVAEALYNLSFAFGYDDPERARDILREALAAFTELGDDGWVAKVHWGLVAVSLWLRDYRAMIEHSEACLPTLRAGGESFDLAWALHMAGVAHYSIGEYEQALVLMHEALDRFVDTADLSGLYLAMADFALVAEARGDHERALRLFGASDRLSEESGVTLYVGQLTFMERPVIADDQLPADDVARYRSEGAAMSHAQMVAYARELTP